MTLLFWEHSQDVSLFTNCFTNMLTIFENFWVVPGYAFTFVRSFHLIAALLRAHRGPLYTFIDVFTRSVAHKTESIQTLTTSLVAINRNACLHTIAIVHIAPISCKTKNYLKLVQQMACYKSSFMWLKYQSKYLFCFPLWFSFKLRATNVSIKSSMEFHFSSSTVVEMHIKTFL